MYCLSNDLEWLNITVYVGKNYVFSCIHIGKKYGLTNNVIQLNMLNMYTRTHTQQNMIHVAEAIY